MNRFFKQFGGTVTQEWIRLYEQSDHWRDGRFQNSEPASLGANLLHMPRVIYKQLTRRKGREPQEPLPVLHFEKMAFLTPSERSKIIWYGHSAVLMRMASKTLLIDPMLGPDTTPIAPFATKRFSHEPLELIDAFPEIDLLLITHDHYDHLDYDSIQKLIPKTKMYFVSMGVKRHLMNWGVPGNVITEFDWWQTDHFGDIEITFTPTRHFSGRGLTDRFKTLWGGWVFHTANEKIWFSGDGGYGNHFSEIGQRLGPFDFAFVECGQYNKDWPEVHLFPREAVEAAIDAGARKAMPVHWAAFALSYQHTWREPADVFVEVALEKQLDYILPPLGHMFETTSVIKEKWWGEYH